MKKNITFKTFGCRLNTYETEVTRKLSEGSNNEDLTVVNTCAVTNDAVKKAMKTRPLPDSRGIISYTTYEVAVARQGDTIKSIAGRLGLAPKNIASYNGMSSLEKLNEGQLISLPNRTKIGKIQKNKSTSRYNEVNVTE